MAESSTKKIEPFKKDLFGSSDSSTDLGEGFSAFSSPFSLGPALVPSKEASASPSKNSVSSQRICLGPGSTPSSYNNSPQSAIKNDSGSADRSSHGNTYIDNTTLDGSELSNVPLDSPDPVGEAIPSSTQSLDVSKLVPVSVRKEQQGWNDPPSAPSLGTTPSRAAVSKASSFPAAALKADDVQIQPLARQLDFIPTQSNQQQAPPPTGSEVGPGATTNPFRIGAGFGSRKPAYGLSGIASFGSSPPMVPAASVPTNQEQLTVPHPGMKAGSAVGTPQSFGHVDLSAVSSSNFPSSTLPPVSLTTCEEVAGGPPTGPGTTVPYVPVAYHWFYLRPEERYWIPFSLVDSSSLENAYLHCHDTSQQVSVPSDGGRYDVDLHSRRRYPVYWEEPASVVARCSWFHKGNGEKWYRPYSEDIASRLEEAYQSSSLQHVWNRRLELDGGEFVVLHSPSSAIHYSSSTATLSQDIEEDRPYAKEVMRGFSDRDKVEAGEQLQIDHLVFVIHGVGSQHDLSFRCLVDCVDDFREVSQLMLKTHTFSNGEALGVGTELGSGGGGGRVEFLPVHWHQKLHTDSLDGRLKLLTLPSISRIREFTNTTLLDILYFTSPLYCQTIMSEVASEMNRLYQLFRERNPAFSGNVSVVGHSLGSVILFDLLCHQPKPAAASAATTAGDTTSGGPSLSGAASAHQEVASESQATPTNVGVVEKEGEDSTDGVTIEEVLTQLGLDNLIEVFREEQIDFESLLLCSDEDLRELRIAMGPRKKLSLYIKQQKVDQEVAQQRKEETDRANAQKEPEVKEEKTEEEFVDGEETRSRFLGVTIVRGLAGTGQTHVEYPQLLFHPKHMFAIGSPIGMFLSVRGVEDLGPEFVLPTCPHVFNIFHPFDPVAYRIEPLLVSGAAARPVLLPHHKGRKRFHLELYDNLGTMGATIKQHFVEGVRNMWLQLNEFARNHTSSPGPQCLDNLDNLDTVLSDTDTSQTSEATVTNESLQTEDWLAAALNQGRRVDHVLQEKPIEKLNEYLFSISSHVTYWRSEDTALFMLKEMYQDPGGHQN